MPPGYLFCKLKKALSQSTSIYSISEYTYSLAPPPPGLVYVLSQSAHILWSPGPKEMENVVKIMLSCKT